MARPAVFFDRDGVVNQSPGAGYVLDWASFRFNPGVAAALALCRRRGYATVLVTSQQGVGKQLMTQATLDEIHANMQHQLQQQDAAFDMILACTHLTGTCDCRKPSPAMVFQAAEALGLDLGRSWLIGDHDRDIQMAVNAGVSGTIRILSHHVPGVPATHTLSDTAALPALLDSLLPPAV